MKMGKYPVRPLVIVLGKLCCSNNLQVLGAYKNKCLLLTYITCLLRMAVSELWVFSICRLHSWIQDEGAALIWSCYSCGRGKERESGQRYAIALKTSAHLPLSKGSHMANLELKMDGTGVHPPPQEAWKSHGSRQGCIILLQERGVNRGNNNAIYQRKPALFKDAVTIN